ncbi:MAG TPA: hypothetical protein PLQ67_02095 [Burkholderiaceae bacterium]|nr:hypothetical protein [Burkholderiaceae bacterium]
MGVAAKGSVDKYRLDKPVSSRPAYFAALPDAPTSTRTDPDTLAGLSHLSALPVNKVLIDIAAFDYVKQKGLVTSKMRGAYAP